MAAYVSVRYVLGIFIAVFCILNGVKAINYIKYETPEDCKGVPDEAGYFTYFDISQLQCTRCDQESAYQTTSEDGLRCVCQPGMKKFEDFGGGKIRCRPCGPNQFVAANGWECVDCATTSSPDISQGTCPSCNRNEKQITVERQLDGQSTGQRTCQRCASYTHPDSPGTRCVRCSHILAINPLASDCSCAVPSGGVCFRSNNDLIQVNTQLFKVKIGSLEVESAYFTDNLRAAHGMCQPQYGNLTACQLLGNLCTAILYSRVDQGTVAAPTSACGAYLSLVGGTGRESSNEWPPNMPWLYYLEDTPATILSDTRLDTQFTFPNTQLQFKVAAYLLNGTFLGIQPVSNGLIQLCKSSQTIMDAAYTFGTSYSQDCQLDVRDLWDEDKYPMVFYDMFLEYTSSSGQTLLYAVPVLVEDYESPNGAKPNIQEDRRNWQLVRRFFLIDNISGKTYTTQNTNDGAIQQTTLTRAKAVRYAESMTISITLQDNTNNGRIYPPHLRIKYGSVRDTDYDKDKTVKVGFKVEYNMKLDKYNSDVSIALGVLSAFALVYAFLQTWSWSKRSARIAMDFVSILQFIYHSLANLANVFFVVCFGASLWWLIFYKRQVAVYLLLPNKSQETSFVAYIAVAFALKAFQLFVMIISQVTVDIFFIDWERPRGRNTDTQKGQEAPVSIWRTYFVANEWNEIQTTRKINSILQIFVVVFFLSVVGFERVATADPLSQLSWSPDQYHSPYNKFFRFAISGLVYILVATVQWIFYTFIYERFIEDKVRQYVDLCSMSNVSVFILDKSNYGYYIHGRSVHGRADTDMREMHENLKREEEDLCGQRGLLPNTEQQTFQMTVPRKLRSQYDKVLIPINSPQQAAQAGGRMTSGTPGSHLDIQTERGIQAYNIINRFLQAFLDHSLRDIDYIIKDKMLVESILDMEFQDSTEKGIFYNDDGHSFDRVLFFGNEVTILLFEILLFTIVDLIAENFVLAGVITYIIMELVVMVRSSMAKKNIAKKTLVDDRFLI